ncbi:hypothetical protein CRI94_09180 [Longibacter salinarum]|uniref:FAS1 domain-containing protein n=1 Tax=Longibacter salinarum TaxID=1850348 RepID=A0A2A8CXZ0_9BACT|nr:fasciclin domain-containing protein [Longibacter salinarum]PEN13481.1 hypothetical protein CRI94_09180 [Longibacter salinarum]
MFTRFASRTLAALTLLFFFAVPAQAQDMGEEPGTIVEVAQSNENFSTLVSALKAAGLVETLQGEGPFTVFAPTNAAFEKLPEGTLDNLLKEENKDQLTAILTYHVAPAKAMAKDVVGMDEAPTVQGQPVQIMVEDGTVMLKGQNTATVTTTDIQASNGVIHVIDTVLMPPASDEMQEGDMGGGER